MLVVQDRPHVSVAPQDLEACRLARPRRIDEERGNEPHVSGSAQGFIENPPEG